MATCETKKIDSNVVGLNYAVEECLGQLPSNPKWQALEPNSFSDFGGELSTTNRTPLSISRQNQKGVVTDLSVKGGFNIDFTQNNLNGLLEGLFFADTRKKAELQVTAVTNDGFTAANTNNKIKPNDIVKASGFKTSSSNKNFTVQTGTTTTSIKVGTLTAGQEKGLLQVVGHAFGNGDLKFTVENGIYGLSTTTKNLTELGLIEGEWIFVGGDQTNSQFPTAGTFYARIATIAEHKITFDNGTFKTGLNADTGQNKSIEIYLGSVLKNENTADLIKRKSYCFERTLGKDLSETANTDKNQAEYISGAVLGEFSLEVKQGEMLNADLSFTATNNEYVTGTLKSNTKLTPSLGESGINTSSDIRSIRLSLVDSTKSTSTPLFAYVTEASIEVNNNLSENKALGTFGAIDVSAGNFEVSGKTTAYFTSVKAIEAVRKNADVGLYALFATKQKGFIFDIPLVGLSGGTLNVEKDNPITLELEASGAENKFGYTMMYVNFPVLPKVAM